MEAELPEHEQRVIYADGDIAVRLISLVKRLFIAE